MSLRSKKPSKTDVCQDFIQKLRDRRGIELEAPGVIEGIQQHFQQLPTRYALDVNIGSLDVLNHKRLLDSARQDPSAVSFQVRPVDVAPGLHGSANMDKRPSFGNLDSLTERIPKPGALPRPAFGSSPNLQALVLEAEERMEGHGETLGREAAFFEVTIASVDQPKLLSRLSEALGDLNLNICEAHAFNTKDKFSLDVFVVNGWRGERDSAPGPLDDWEVDPAEIQFHEKIASGAFGDLYRGTYCGQDVAIKIVRNVQNDTAQFQEFLQEVAIMRKVRHRNVVQFIGACTQKPNLCIVFEFMAGGSIFDHMRKGNQLKLIAVLKVGTEVCRGMDYLHKRKIVHRDLKAANLLMDDSGIVKIADFGVARVMDTLGVMTAETGTYRWMAPEVIEHAPYKEKADVFSFGIVLWELLTGRVPYSEMTPLQAAVGVVQKGLRPQIPPNTPPALAELMQECWRRNPQERPSFEQLKARMETIWQAAQQDESLRRGQTGLLSKFRKSKG
eukprot:jgi/Astpho2/437/fgenesh1_pm.00011_%23_16_t